MVERKNLAIHKPYFTLVWTSILFHPNSEQALDHFFTLCQIKVGGQAGSRGPLKLVDESLTVA